MGTHSKSSKSMDKKGVEADGMGGTDGMRSHKSTFMDPGKANFVGNIAATIRWLQGVRVITRPKRPAVSQRSIGKEDELH